MKIDTTENTQIAQGKIGQRKYTAFAEEVNKGVLPEWQWEVELIIHNNDGGIYHQIRRTQFSRDARTADKAIRATIREWKNDYE